MFDHSAQLDRIEAIAGNILRLCGYLPLLLKIDLKELKLMSDILDATTALTAQVATETTVDQSAVTLLAGLTKIIGDLQTQVAQAADVPAALAAVKAASAAISTNQAALAAAVTANTPAAPPTP